jgi:hypothetical protein
MNPRPCILSVAATLLAACNTIDGSYEPRCAAFAGDRVELRDGTATWDKFTDEVRLDAAGNVVDPFPGFPRRGEFAASEGKVTIHFRDDDSERVYFLHQYRGDVLLLTAAEQDEWRRQGRIADCALRRGEPH